MEDEEEVVTKRIRIAWIYPCEKEDVRNLVKSLIDADPERKELEKKLITNIYDKIVSRDPRTPWILSVLLEELDNKGILIISKENGEASLPDAYLLSRQDLDTLLEILNKVLKDEEFKKVVSSYLIWEDCKAVIIRIKQDSLIDKLVSDLIPFLNSRKELRTLLVYELSEAIFWERHPMRCVLEAIVGEHCLDSYDIIFIWKGDLKPPLGYLVQKYTMDYIIETLKERLGEKDFKDACRMRYL